MNSQNSVKNRGLGNTIKPQKKCRSWCFTINNHTEEIWKSLTLLKDRYKIKKIIFQEEVGENNNFHLQGVIQFENQILFKSLKELFPTGHWEPCRNLKGSIKYCSKEESRAGKTFSYGVKKNEVWRPKLTEEEILDWGRRTSIEEFRKHMDADLCRKLMGNML